MKKIERLLNNVYYENRATNRNLQRITTIGLVALLSNSIKEAKEKDDKKIVGIGRAALFTLAITQLLLLVSDITSMIQRKKSEELLDYEEE